jgi:hypothetical protein
MRPNDRDVLWEAKEIGEDDANKMHVELEPRSLSNLEPAQRSTNNPFTLNNMSAKQTSQAMRKRYIEITPPVDRQIKP